MGSAGSPHGPQSRPRVWVFRRSVECLSLRGQSSRHVGSNRSSSVFPRSYASRPWLEIARIWIQQREFKATNAPLPLFRNEFQDNRIRQASPPTVELSQLDCAELGPAQQSESQACKTGIQRWEDSLDVQASITGITRTCEDTRRGLVVPGLCTAAASVLNTCVFLGLAFQRDNLGPDYSSRYVFLPGGLAPTGLCWIFFDFGSFRGQHRRLNGAKVMDLGWRRAVTHGGSL